MNPFVCTSSPEERESHNYGCFFFANSIHCCRRQWAILLVYSSIPNLHSTSCWGIAQFFLHTFLQKEQKFLSPFLSFFLHSYRMFPENCLLLIATSVCKQKDFFFLRGGLFIPSQRPFTRAAKTIRGHTRSMWANLFHTSFRSFVLVLASRT